MKNGKTEQRERAHALRTKLVVNATLTIQNLTDVKAQLERQIIDEKTAGTYNGDTLEALKSVRAAIHWL